MHTLSTEHHAQTNRADIAANIVQHLAVHRLYGQAVIVTDKPQAMLGDIKKAWRRAGHHTWLCDFAARPPGEDSYAQVLLASPAECMRFPPGCATMYVTCPVSRSDLHFITSWMPRYGVVVMYTGAV